MEPCLQDLLFGLAVQGRCGLVAEQNGGVLEEGARECHPLLLAPAQLQAPLTDAHLVAIRHGQDLVMD